MEDPNQNNNNFLNNSSSFYNNSRRISNTEEVEDDSYNLNSNNIFNQTFSNSNKLENIIIKNLDENEILINDENFQKNEDENDSNISREYNGFSFNPNSSFRNHHKYNSSQISENFNNNESPRQSNNNLNNIYSENNNMQYSQNNRDNLNNSYDENKEELYSGNIKINTIKTDNNNSSISNKDINNQNLERCSQKEIISLIKNRDFSSNKNNFIIKNFSRINSILSSRNTVPYNQNSSYSSLASFPSIKKAFNKNKNYNDSLNNSKNSINDKYNEEQVKIIQKRWRFFKKFFDKKNQIIKIQSVWRGKYVRKYIYETIFLCYLVENFYIILKKFILRLIWNRLFNKNNISYLIILKLKKLYMKYQIIKPTLQSWKCKAKIISYKISNINKNYIFNKKLNIQNSNFVFKKPKIKKQNNNNDVSNNELKNKINYKKILFLNNIFLKICKKRIKSVFECLIKYNLNLNYFSEIIKKSINRINDNIKDNNFIKKYYLYKWINNVKMIQIYELKKKMLKYILNTISKKYEIKILFKYFSRWKLYTDDSINKLNKLKYIKKKEKINYRKNKLKILINKTFEIKSNIFCNIFILIIRKWKLFVFLQKLNKKKKKKIDEIFKNTFNKIGNDLFDFEEEIEKKYNIINNFEEEEDFVKILKKKYKFN